MWPFSRIQALENEVRVLEYELARSMDRYHQLAEDYHDNVLWTSREGFICGYQFLKPDAEWEEFNEAWMICSLKQAFSKIFPPIPLGKMSDVVGVGPKTPRTGGGEGATGP